MAAEVWRVEGESFLVEIEAGKAGLFAQGYAKDLEDLLSGGGRLLTDAEVQSLREFLDRHDAAHRKA